MDSLLTTPLPSNEPSVSSRANLGGEEYVVVLERLHRVLSPQTYLEIGVNEGASLRLSQFPTIAIDPDTSRLRDVFKGKSQFFLFQMGSDAFFRSHDPKHYLGKEVDFAFIDGMHWWEFILRDFANVERHARPNSVIALHDCLPTNAYIAERENESVRRKAMGAPENLWAGDGWKVLPILKKYRPDLHIIALDAPPTGLVLITNLNPDSNILRDQYFEICRETEGQNLLTYGLDKYFEEMDVRSTTELARWQDISGRFWF